MPRTLISRSRQAKASDKARWHQVEGAGKAKVIRRFFGVSPDDEREIVKKLQRWQDRQP